MNPNTLFIYCEYNRFCKSFILQTVGVGTCYRYRFSRACVGAGEKMGFNTGTVVIPFGTVAQESLDVAKYVYDNVIKENSSFNYIVRNGAAFSVSGYVIDKKEYGVIIVRCYIKRHCLEFAVLKSEIKPLQ